ncbi:MAG TPA: hypothetical protein VFB16_07660 [Bauldia sp.]|nr:hypothetical protein [Bauldia sp.]
MPDLAVLLLATLLAALAFSGWGRLILRLAGHHAAEVGVAEMWIGVTALTVLVTLLHFVTPIDWTVTLALGLIGALAALLPDRGAAWRRLVAAAAAGARAHPLEAGLVLIFVLGLALHAMARPDRYDSGLYYFASIRWLNEYRIVPGLGNLLDRLAHSEAIFRPAALLNAHPLWGRGYAVLLFFLELLAAATVLASGVWRLRGGILAVAGAAAAIAFQTSEAPSAAADYVVALASVGMLVVLLRIIATPAAEGAGREDALLLAGLALLAVLMKYSAAAFALAALAVAAPWLARTARRHPRAALAAAALGVIAIAGQAARSYMLSGVPFYPAEIGGLWDLPWAMSRRAVFIESAFIYAWARVPTYPPTALFGNWDWLGAWARAFPLSGWVTIAGTILFGAGNLVLALVRPGALGRPTPLCPLRPDRGVARLLVLLRAVAPLPRPAARGHARRRRIPPLPGSRPPPPRSLPGRGVGRAPRCDPLSPRRRNPGRNAFRPHRSLLPADPGRRPRDCDHRLGAEALPPAGGRPVLGRAPPLHRGYPRDDIRLLGAGLQSGFTRKPPPAGTAPSAASP